VDFPLAAAFTERLLSLNLGCSEPSLSGSRELLLSLLDCSKLELGDVGTLGLVADNLALCRFYKISSLTSSS